MKNKLANRLHLSNVSIISIKLPIMMQIVYNNSNKKYTESLPNMNQIRQDYFQTIDNEHFHRTENI